MTLTWRELKLRLEGLWSEWLRCDDTRCNRLICWTVDVPLLRARRIGLGEKLGPMLVTTLAPLRTYYWQLRGIHVPHNQLVNFIEFWKISKFFFYPFSLYHISPYKLLNIVNFWELLSLVAKKEETFIFGSWFHLLDVRKHFTKFCLYYCRLKLQKSLFPPIRVDAWKLRSFLNS